MFGIPFSFMDMSFMFFQGGIFSQLSFMKFFFLSFLKNAYLGLFRLQGLLFHGIPCYSEKVCKDEIVIFCFTLHCSMVFVFEIFIFKVKAFFPIFEQHNFQNMLIHSYYIPCHGVKFIIPSTISVSFGIPHWFQVVYIE